MIKTNPIYGVYNIYKNESDKVSMAEEFNEKDKNSSLFESKPSEVIE